MVVPDPFLNFWTMFLKLELSQEDRVKGLKQGMEPPCDRITSGHQTLRSSNCCDLRNPLPKVFLGNGNPRRKFENYKFRPVIPSSRGTTSLEKKTSCWQSPRSTSQTPAWFNPRHLEFQMPFWNRSAKFQRIFTSLFKFGTTLYSTLPSPVNIFADHTSWRQT